MDPITAFQSEVAEHIKGIGEDRAFIALSNQWNQAAIEHHYAHNFSWLGRPIIQAPPDTYSIQELIWKIKPDLVIETGIAHGGSLILSASMLALLDYCDATTGNTALNPRQSKRRVLGIDIDIRAHNRAAIEAHPMQHLIKMIEGSSIDEDVVTQVKSFAKDFERVMVFLDSNHTHAHVLAELEAYAPLVTRDSYCVVWDTGVEDLPDGFVTDRPWGKGDNPKTAVFEYLRRLASEGRVASDGQALCFSIDKTIEYKLAITAAPDGFLQRITG